MPKIDPAPPYEALLTKWIVFVFLLIGLGLRLIQIAFLEEYRDDELMNFFLVYLGNWGQYINDSQLHENFTFAPLFFLAYHFWSVAFGAFEYGPWFFVFWINSLALALFAYLTHKRPVAFLLMVFSLSAIHWAAEAKQFSADLLVSTLLLIAFHNYEKRKKLGWLTLLGCLAPWASFPSVFILTVIAFLLIWDRLALGNKRIAVVLALWAASFLLLWDQVLLPKTSVGKAIEYWSPYFNFTQHALRSAIGYSSLLAMGFLALCGLGAKKHRVALVALGPFLFLAIAGAFQKYPLVERTLIFTLPGLFLIMGEGFHQLWKRPIAIKAGAVLLLGVLLFKNVGAFSQGLKDPFTRGNKSKVALLTPFLQPGDTIEIDARELASVIYYGWLKGWAVIRNGSIKTPHLTLRSILTDPKIFVLVRDRLSDFSPDVEVHFERPKSHSGNLWNFSTVPHSLPSPLLVSLAVSH